jgi:hypothetical protein
LNNTQQGHIAFGFPILYENEHWLFFKQERASDWEALDELLDRPWWGRTWVVQEVWNASNAILQCGSKTIKWKTFAKAMDYHEAWDDMGSLVRETSRGAQWMNLRRRYSLAIHLSGQRLKGSTTSDLLWNTWNRASTDPRDKVFAIQALVGNDSLTRPDYSKTMNQVYREAARDIILKEKHMDILLAANGLARRDGLPSWVPDWRREAGELRPNLFVNRRRLFTLHFSGSMDELVVNGHGYSAAGKSNPVASFDDDLSVLRVSAIKLDVISELGPVYGDTFDGEELLRESYNMVERSSLVRKSHKSMDKVREILVGGWASVKESKGVMENVMRGRRVFVSQNGHIGAGPRQLQSSDVVFIISGCNFPMILRPEDGYFVVVGEAYGKHNMFQATFTL